MYIFCLYMLPFAITMSTWSFAKFDMEQRCSWSNSKPLNLNHFPLCNSCCSYFFHLEWYIVCIHFNLICCFEYYEVYHGICNFSFVIEFHLHFLIIVMLCFFNDPPSPIDKVFKIGVKNPLGVSCCSIFYACGCPLNYNWLPKFIHGDAFGCQVF